MEGHHAFGHLLRFESLRLPVSKKEIDCFAQTDAGAASRGQELFKFVVYADARLKRVWDDAVLGITIEFRELPIEYR